MNLVLKILTLNLNGLNKYVSKCYDFKILWFPSVWFWSCYNFESIMVLEIKWYIITLVFEMDMIYGFGFGMK